jgi:hypothetical protein
MARELAVLFGVGNRWYWRDNGSPNIVDWQLPWGVGAVEAKLTSASAWRFDGNEYNINALGHPGFGMLTHFLARENNYSLAESFLISTVASGTWEIFLEWAEYGSLNDMLTTSTAGVPLGEAAHQLIHHYKEAQWSGRAGVGSSGGTPFGVVQLGGDLTRLPSTTGKVRGGRAVSMNAEVQVDDALRSIDGEARANLTGYYQEREDKQTFAALTTRFAYRNHEARPERDQDLLTTVGIGPTVDVTMERGGATMTFGADGFVDVALVKSQAYDSWRTMNPTEVVRNVMQDKPEPYYYGMGAFLKPHVDVTYGNYRAGGSVSGAVFSSIDDGDRDQEMMTANPHFSDTEANAEAHVGYDHERVSILLEGRAARRGGSAGASDASTTSQTAMLTAGFSL